MRQPWVLREGKHLVRRGYLVLEGSGGQQDREELGCIQTQDREGIECRGWVLVLLQREVVVRTPVMEGIRTVLCSEEGTGAEVEDVPGVEFDILLVLGERRIETGDEVEVEVGVGKEVEVEIEVEVGKELVLVGEIQEVEESGKGAARGTVGQEDRKVGLLVLHFRIDQRSMVQKSLIEKVFSGRKKEPNWAWEEGEAWRQLAQVWEGLEAWKEELGILVWQEEQGLGAWEEEQEIRVCWVWEEEMGWVDPFWVGEESWWPRGGCSDGTGLARSKRW